MTKDLKSLPTAERRELLEQELQQVAQKYSDQKAKISCSINSSGHIECKIEFEL